VALTIGVLKETDKRETRVAASPDIVKKYVSNKISVLIEKDAGAGSYFGDAEYKDAGAKVASRSDVLKKSDIVLCVRRPDAKDLKALPKKATLIGCLNPYDDKQDFEALANAGVTSMSMELVPRITRAQAMDVLSSQSNLAGYKSVLEAAAHYDRALPMMMTAAGTIAPARVFVLGAGVAGLQAIATAKRLGAIVSATDVRPAAKEQVASLGGNFVAVEDEEFKAAETAGGYAKEMSDEYKKKQAALVAETLIKQDIVITTALIPGRPAPVLITEEHVKSMKPGSVIVDLAVERGGNCALSEPDKIVEKHGVKIIGHTNMTGLLGQSASKLYAKNLYNLLALFIKDGKAAPDMEDEILKGITLTAGGVVVHPVLGETKVSKKKAPIKKATVKKTTAKTKAKAKPKAKVKLKATAKTKTKTTGKK
tara:strand:+ start:745102 stop:746373 length:1272 start_codon:yes stop_codon:yes gene_type:complete